jgi:hypothetical protein
VCHCVILCASAERPLSAAQSTYKMHSLWLKWFGGKPVCTLCNMTEQYRPLVPSGKAKPHLRSHHCNALKSFERFGRKVLHTLFHTNSSNDRTPQYFPQLCSRIQRCFDSNNLLILHESLKIFDVFSWTGHWGPKACPQTFLKACTMDSANSCGPTS